MRSGILAGMLLCVLMLQASQALARDAKWRLGLNYGVLSEKKIAYIKTDEGAPVGFEAARKLGDKFELGLSYTYAEVKYKSTLLPVELGFDDNFIMLFGNFNLDGLLKGLYAGPQLGLVSRTLRKENDNIGLEALGFGARAGYEYFITGELSVGAQAQFVSVGEAEKTVTDDNVKVNYSLDDTSFMTYLLSVNYRF